MFSQPLISDRHIKWAAFIQSFQPILQYHPGKENVVVDALSPKPQINHLSIVQSVSFASMPDTYAQDKDFTHTWLQTTQSNSNSLVDYTLQNIFLYF